MSSLFTSVLLYFTIDVILRKIYRGKEIITNTTLNELKNCYYFAQKMYIFYLMDNFIYKKICIAIGSPLRPTAELERSLLSKLSSYMTSWKRCVDDTITYVKTDAINHVLSILNSFHSLIHISFLDILILRNSNSFETTVNRKSTHNDIFLHWESFAPNI